MEGVTSLTIVRSDLDGDALWMVTNAANPVGWIEVPCALQPGINRFCNVPDEGKLFDGLFGDHLYSQVGLMNRLLRLRNTAALREWDSVRGVVNDQRDKRAFAAR